MTEAEKLTEPQAEIASATEPISFAEFLEGIPPSQNIKIKDLCAQKHNPGVGYFYQLQAPELQLHCTSNACNGLRFFRFAAGSRSFPQVGEAGEFFITYICSNCRETLKVFALQATRDSQEPETGHCYKYGEDPPYGPPTPARLIRMLGDDRELFLKGRRCESQGLGIGAFVYYRRAVEHQKNRILDEIIRVSKKIGASTDVIETLDSAKKEIQFSKALASVRDAIPQALLINGHNPITLLHSALSGGLHEQTDEKCLELAHDVRVVLVELSERLGSVLKDEAEFNTAVARLMKAKQDK